ncbi:Bacteriophage/plasmid primase P4-like protein [Klebsormidium nitens]|uniref:Bacteriophage/plasmid primase P4-like protein n=1 Tax=Klebsormidium nitens TaxID=105231 RepID=A0A1Y1IUL9_KLENI|nr:Bacteriophage/plasmid primase P4-like protein [Klebsormidium nitens]|eukprot:GAQ92546.1 Bacteriophage/plasmid primase P4-like protein [Klebsormidium nitens]
MLSGPEPSSSEGEGDKRSSVGSDQEESPCHFLQDEADSMMHLSQEVGNMSLSPGPFRRHAKRLKVDFLSEGLEDKSSPAISSSDALVPALPLLSDVDTAPCLDPILAAAHHFHSLGVVTITFDLEEERNKKSEVRKAAKDMGYWKRANHDNCLSEKFARPGRNSIAIITEESDLFAVDVDVKDGGFEALQQMLEEHDNFPEDTPRLTTGNKGMHVLFSLSKSEEAGLRNGSNRTRIRYKGEKVGIDIRGRGGMLYTAPSSYQGLDGELRRYEWDHEILPDRSNLMAIPDWLIAILNEDQSGPPQQQAKGGHPSSCLPPSWEFFDKEPDIAVLERIKSCFAECGDSGSRFDKRKGNLYVFRVQGERTCPYGHHHQGSNNLSILVKGSSFYYHCNSSECQSIMPRKQIGDLSGVEEEARGSVRPVDVDGDEAVLGIVYTSAGFYMWTGKVYERAHDVQVLYILMHQLSTIIDRVRRELREEERKIPKDDKAKLEIVEAKLKLLRDYNNRRTTEDTLKVVKGKLFSNTFLNELDRNPDILNVSNGVIDLRTGKLDIHRPRYMCTKLAETIYSGLELPSPRIEDFFNDVFKGEEEVIRTLQIVLGYGMTGSKACEIMVFWIGLGGNGKGVTKEMLEKALGPYCGVMSTDVVVRTAGQRPASKGAPTPHVCMP